MGPRSINFTNFGNANPPIQAYVRHSSDKIFMVCWPLAVHWLIDVFKFGGMCSMHSIVMKFN